MLAKLNYSAQYRHQLPLSNGLHLRSTDINFHSNGLICAVQTSTSTAMGAVQTSTSTAMGSSAQYRHQLPQQWAHLRSTDVNFHLAMGPSAHYRRQLPLSNGLHLRSTDINFQSNGLSCAVKTSTSTTMGSSAQYRHQFPPSNGLPFGCS